MAIPTLDPEQYQFLEDVGVVMNTDAALPFIDIHSVDGLDSPPVRHSSTPREGTHGGYVDAQFEDIRTITFEGNIYAPVDEYEEYCDLLKANFAPRVAVGPLFTGTDAGMRVLFAKSLGIRYVKDQMRRLGVSPFQLQFLVEDPRWYDPTPTVQALPGTLALSGNRETTGIITINGSRTNPVITKGSSSLTFAYTLAGGNTIVIDLDKRTVILNGTTNLRDKLTVTGGWPVLSPGNNVFTLGGTGAGAISISARSAWR